jgi:prevent-host-death family protein
MFHTQTISATEFKAKCLDILDRLNTSELDEVVITKRGKTVAILTPPKTQAEAVKSLHGFMRGSVIIPEGIDLTAPLAEDDFAADTGLLHG